MHSSPIQDWQNKKIMIIGDVMIDRYHYGNIDRVSPEAPVPILSLNQTQNRLGGAANVALNVKALGAIPYIFGVVGKDNDAFTFFDLIKKESLDEYNIIQDKQRPTTVKTRMYAAQKQLLRVDQESIASLSLSKEQELWLLIERRINTKNIDAIVFQDYNKGVLTPFIIKETITLAQLNDIPVIVDPKFDNFFAYKGVTLFKPNLKEIKQQANFDISPTDLKSLKNADAFLKKQLQHKITMITLSEYGVYIDDDSEQFISPTLKKSIVDVCGAGDTVLSIAALSMTIDISLKDMGILANLAGGQVCGSVGVVAVSKEMLEKEYRIYKKKSAHKL
jgi:rfaE bifunctional protein kinase chain/domain